MPSEIEQPVGAFSKTRGAIVYPDKVTTLEKVIKTQGPNQTNSSGARACRRAACVEIESQALTDEKNRRIYGFGKETIDMAFEEESHKMMKELEAFYKKIQMQTGVV